MESTGTQRSVLSLPSDARRRRDALLRRRIPVTEKALVGLDRALLERLSEACAPSLLDTFIIYRTFLSSQSTSELVNLGESQQHRRCYDEYLAGMRRGTVKEYFVERPVIARAVTTILEHWIESTRELLERISQDLDLIRRTFSRSRPLGPVTELKSNLSDPHNGGRNVIAVTFAAGLRVGYKPRPVEIDITWQHLLSWLASSGAPPYADAPVVLVRDSYGWVQWIEPAACPDQVSARKFFSRAGAMLCLVQLLQAFDFNCENIIADAERPVAIDLETLMHPPLPDSYRHWGQETAMGKAEEHLRDSVIGTGYLPSRVALIDGRSVGAGGLDATDCSPTTQWSIVHTNTDAMGTACITLRRESSPNLPNLAGKSLPSDAFAAEIIQGYEAMFRFLISIRKELFGPQGPLRVFEGQTSKRPVSFTQQTVEYRHLCGSALLTDLQVFQISQHAPRGAALAGACSWRRIIS